MKRGSFFRRAKKIFIGSSSSRGESSMPSETPTTPVHPDSSEEVGCSGTQQNPRHSYCAPTNVVDEGLCLVDDQGVPTRRRGRTTCADIQSMPPGMKVLIEANENNVPCNVAESAILSSYLGVIARDPVLAPISFTDWRKTGLDPFKKKMLAEVESKFLIPGQIRPYILQSLGVRWRNYKTSLKAEYWDGRPIEEIMENVPAGVDPAQWCQLVSHWAKPESQERAAQNSANAKKLICPHTMGRASSVRRQKETSIKDRLQLWRINRIRKDGSWSSEEAKLRWDKVCELLAAEGLTPEDDNVEANERIFNLVMGPEHPGRVRTQGFGVTPSRYFMQNNTTEGASSSGGSSARFSKIEDDITLLRSEVRQYMERFDSQFPPHGGSSQMGGNDHSSED